MSYFLKFLLGSRAVFGSYRATACRIYYSWCIYVAFHCSEHGYVSECQPVTQVSCVLKISSLISVHTSWSYFRSWITLKECIGFAQVRNESLAPGLLHAQLKTPSLYGFTILSLIVPSYSYSCGLRELIEAVN